MKFDKNEILTLIEDFFYDDIYSYIMNCVADYDSQDLEDAFEEMVDYAEFDVINHLDIANIELEEDEDTITVMADLQADVSVIGYSYWGGENMEVGSAELFMGFGIQFDVKDGQCFDFWIEHQY